MRMELGKRCHQLVLDFGNWAGSTVFHVMISIWAVVVDCGCWFHCKIACNLGKTDPGFFHPETLQCHENQLTKAGGLKIGYPPVPMVQQFIIIFDCLYEQCHKLMEYSIFRYYSSIILVIINPTVSHVLLIHTNAIYNIIKIDITDNIL
jgi:hypothetical protein